MGLLQKLNSGVYDTPELSFKENQNIKSLVYKIKEYNKSIDELQHKLIYNKW